MTRLDLANAALVRTGQRSLQSLDEDSADSRLVNLLLEDSIREVLREVKPHSARKSTKLVRLSNNPLFGYKYAYQLPADYVGGIQCFNSRGENDDNLYWEIEGEALLTDAEVIYCKYIAIPTDVDILDVGTSRAISLKLAIQLAYSKTTDKNLVEGLITEYETLIMQKARSLDTIENRKDTTFGNEMDWIESRNINFRP